MTFAVQYMDVFVLTCCFKMSGEIYYSYALR